MFFLLGYLHYRAAAYCCTTWMLFLAWIESTNVKTKTKKLAIHVLELCKLAAVRCGCGWEMIVRKILRRRRRLLFVRACALHTRHSHVCVRVDRTPYHRMSSVGPPGTHGANESQKVGDM